MGRKKIDGKLFDLSFLSRISFEFDGPLILWGKRCDFCGTFLKWKVGRMKKP